MKSVPLTTVAPLVNERISRFDGTRPFLATGGLDGGERLRTEEVTFDDRPTRADVQVLAGDVCIARMQATLKVLQCREQDEWLILSTGFAVLRPNSSHLDSRFLYHFVRSPSFQAAKDRLCSGATQKAITNENIRTLSVPLLSMAQQHRIAAILDQADELRAKRRAALDQLNGLTQSVFLEMFGDPATNRHRFPMMSLKDLFVFRTGKLDSNAAVTNGRYPFFTCSRDDLRIDDYAFDCEALLLAGNNASANYSVKHYSGRFNAYQRTYVITLRDATYSYEFARFALEYQLAEMKRRSKGTGTKYLTLEILNRMSIPVSPVEAQHEFSRQLAAVGRVQAIHRSSMGLLEGLCSGLQSRAFAGAL